MKPRAFTLRRIAPAPARPRSRCQASGGFGQERFGSARVLFEYGMRMKRTFWRLFLSKNVKCVFHLGEGKLADVRDAPGAMACVERSGETRELDTSTGYSAYWLRVHHLNLPPYPPGATVHATTASRAAASANARRSSQVGRS